MNEPFDFPKELRCDSMLLKKTHPYTADMLERAATEIVHLRSEIKRLRNSNSVLVQRFFSIEYLERDGVVSPAHHPMTKETDQ